MKQHQFIVSIPAAAGFTKADAKKYIQTAVRSWAGGGDPQAPVWDLAGQATVEPYVDLTTHPVCDALPKRQQDWLVAINDAEEMVMNADLKIAGEAVVFTPLNDEGFPGTELRFFCGSPGEARMLKAALNEAVVGVEVDAVFYERTEL